MMRVTAGGALAESEVHRMVRKKMAAFVEAQMMMASGALACRRKQRAVAKKIIGVYRNRVRQNMRRLCRFGELELTEATALY